MYSDYNFDTKSIILFDIPNNSMRILLACSFYRYETETKREKMARLNHTVNKWKRMSCINIKFFWVHILCPLYNTCATFKKLLQQYCEVTKVGKLFWFLQMRKIMQVYSHAQGYATNEHRGGVGHGFSVFYYVFSTTPVCVYLEILIWEVLFFLAKIHFSLDSLGKS